MKLFINRLLFIVLVTSTSEACLHYPDSKKIKITEGLQEFFVFHDGENAHIILRTQLSASKFPKEIAWVLPFPALPAAYKEVDGPLFQELSQQFVQFESNLMQKGRGGALGNDGGGAGIKVHDQVQVGGFQIQPIEILKETGGDELNTWLQKNKFNPMPVDKQKRYLKKGAAFLAIRMKMNKPGEADLVSRPLQVMYPATSIAVPMLFTHEGRTFDMDIYVFSSKEMKTDLSKQYLKKVATVPYSREHARPMIESIIGERKGWITKYSGKELNSVTKKLSQVTQDPVFSKADL
ncbi:MAG: DUF2330 domain-containing protein [Bdellovibrionaceae bacterium]|jgi:hypothetical protein|nr:DUF2330 domain-containing protein [Pseudobdellovibrionaceae bacterium]